MSSVRPGSYFWEWNLYGYHYRFLWLLCIASGGLTKQIVIYYDVKNAILQS